MNSEVVRGGIGKPVEEMSAENKAIFFTTLVRRAMDEPTQRQVLVVSEGGKRIGRLLMYFEKS